MNNNPRFQRASTGFAVSIPVYQATGGTGAHQPINNPAPHHTHRTGSTADDQPRHHRERHPVDEHQARVQQKHAGALRELARRLKADNERNIDAALNRLWARLHPQAAPMEE